MEIKQDSIRSFPSVINSGQDQLSVVPLLKVFLRLEGGVEGVCASGTLVAWNISLNALYYYCPCGGCLEAKLEKLGVFRRVVPAFEMFHISEFDDD